MKTSVNFSTCFFYSREYGGASWKANQQPRTKLKERTFRYPKVSAIIYDFVLCTFSHRLLARVQINTNFYQSKPN
jgi:hypothetical protein